MSSARHRLFFALVPDEALRARILATAAALPAGGGRATDPRKLHLTLVFLGDGDPELARQAGARAAAEASAFDFALDECDGFHGGTWILRAPAAPFAALMDALTAHLQAVGLRAAEAGRAFVPHVTLRRRAGARLPRAPIAPIGWRASELSLYDSRLDSGHYETLARWPLARHPASPHARRDEP